ncbi:hypothetical protein ACJIZ3_011885 [Penstemon smallii]|uniref:Uncharacterized protein n=1 Tax=Penstemon smallii TaxID=265156 RepID=A0ABD3UNL6_9LAMI
MVKFFLSRGAMRRLRRVLRLDRILAQTTPCKKLKPSGDGVLMITHKNMRCGYYQVFSHNRFLCPAERVHGVLTSKEKSTRKQFIGSIVDVGKAIVFVKFAAKRFP